MFQVVLPVRATDVALFTPGPVRWKLWALDLSLIANEYAPGLSEVTFFVPCLSEIVKPGPTVPATFGFVAASALATSETAAIRTTTAIAMRRMWLLLWLSNGGLYVYPAAADCRARVR